MAGSYSGGGARGRHGAAADHPRPDNPLYFDILQAFKQRTGLPVLVNTSFNVHEEPIINRPEECLRALEEKRVDFVVTPSGVWERI